MYSAHDNYRFPDFIFRVTGRPRIEVDVEDIEFLRGLRFSWTNVAKVLGISRSTLYRRLEEEGISRETHYSDMSDSDLDSLVREIKRAHPNDGERLMIGHLSRYGVTVPRARLRGSIHRVDPVGTRMRRSVTIRRRVYCSAGPNAVWHIDGNHKLIRWRFVIHGGIDGYSRLIVYLKCADNNRALTVLSLYTDAVHLHGLPNRARSDLGGENVDVWRYMIEQHSSNEAVITGSSTHNERIERLWRDVYRCVGVLFADTFRELEETNLDPLNEVDMFCLHYVYLPRINAVLEEFIESWNNHSLSTAGSLTPNQLFVQTAVGQDMIPQLPQQTMANPTTQSTPPAADLDRVAVPRIRFQPCSILQRQLRTVNPLRLSGNFGCDIYEEVIGIVRQHLSRGCTHCN